MLGLPLQADPRVESALAQVESRMQGRLGVFAIRGAKVLSHRGNERFAYCSTFKWVLGAAVLKRVDDGQLQLGQWIPYTEKDLLEPCPVARAHVREGRMTVGDLCAGTIATSDNAAANLLEARVGGPAGLQAFVRGLGDSTMRFDRMEPELNRNLPGDSRDTTTPEAMVRLLKTALETEALSASSRSQLLVWMKATVTGANRIPAALPTGWSLGHKTGSGDRGATNDVAVLFPPQGSPIYLCVFTDGDRKDMKTHEAAIAQAAEIALKALFVEP